VLIQTLLAQGVLRWRQARGGALVGKIWGAEWNDAYALIFTLTAWRGNL